MALLNTRSLNQELQSLLTFAPNVHSKIESYHFLKESKSDFNNDALIQTMYYPDNSKSSYEDPNIYSSPCDYRALIECLSQSFPDFDFSTVSSKNFKLIDSINEAQQQINWNFQNLIPDCFTFIKHLWNFLDTEIDIQSSFIYVYESDRPDAFSEMGSAFNMCSFLLNEKLNKIVLIYLQESVNDFDDDEIDSELDNELHLTNVWY